jgi:prophage regulatory protein
MAEQIHKALAILRLNQVKVRTGLSRSTLYAKISKGEFPTQISLGKRAVGFIESEIDEWIARQIEHSRKAA